MKMLKADERKPSHPKGVLTRIDTGPLFPRLHVNETEKAGPKPPPRNKMALYEQFTVPSYRLVSSAAANTCQRQYRFNDYQPSYASYYVSPVVRVSSTNAIPMHASHALSSSGISNGSTVVSENESQRVPGSQPAKKQGNPVVIRMAATPGASNSSVSASTENSKVNTDFCVPTPSSQGLSKERAGKEVSTAVNSSIDGFESYSNEVVVKPGTATAEESARANLHGSSKAGMVCSLSETQISLSGKSAESKINAQQRQPEPVIQQSSENAVNEPNIMMSLPHSTQQSACTHAECQRKLEAVCHDKLLATEAPSQSTNAGESLILTRERSISVKPVMGPMSSTPPQIEFSSHTKDDQKSLSCLCEDNTVGLVIVSVNKIQQDKDQISEDSKTPRAGNNECSKSSEDGKEKKTASDDSAVSMLDSLSSLSLKPKDVIRAVGQQQFWKARKALIRHQQIISEQVFELHKLIKVQQLLAETSNVLVSEDLLCNGMADVPQCARVVVDLNNRKELHAQEALDPVFFPERCKVPPCRTGAPIESTSQLATNSSSSGAASLPAFTPGGVSTWGYPSVNLGQWMGPMAYQARPLIYQPFAGNLPAGSMFGPGSFGPVPIMPLGLPETSVNMQPFSHGPAAAMTQFWLSGMCANPALGLAQHGLSGMLQHGINPHQAWQNAERGTHGPAGSKASINDKQEASTKTIKMRQLDTEDACQAEQSSRSSNSDPKTPTLPAADSKFTQFGWYVEECSCQSASLRSATSIPGNTSGHADGGSLARTVHDDGKAANYSRRQTQDISCARVSADVDENNHSVNVLNLFPMIPSPLPLYQNEGRASSRQTKEWQGRVIKAVPRPAISASESAVDILLSIQHERRL